MRWVYALQTVPDAVVGCFVFWIEYVPLVPFAWLLGPLSAPLEVGLPLYSRICRPEYLQMGLCMR